ncbi:MAG: A24 family peptidase [Synergistaceae bacterium]|nr:A24 family peptidase [Synergistaceae bacterium]
MDLNVKIYYILSGIAAFVCGACLGSFINAAAMRTVARKKWWGVARSTCDSCGEVLGARDLVPIISYIALRGKCRFCGTRIYPRHIAAEIISGLLTTALLARWGLSAAFCVSLIVVWFSLFNSLTDLDTGYIYDAWALTPCFAGLLMRLAGGWPAVLDGVLGAALGFGLIALIIIVSRGGMGWGDAFLMCGIGGAVGWKYCAFCLYGGFIVGGIVVLPLMIAKKIKRRDRIPLGPFLAAGSVIMLFVGSDLIFRFKTIFGAYPGWPWGG